MSEQNGALARRLYDDCWNAKKPEVANEIYAANHKMNEPGSPPAADGPKGVIDTIALYRSAFPDAHMTVHDVVASGDRVTIRWTATGTHTGDGLGIPPTGKAVRVSGLMLSRVENGKIAETWSLFDKAGMLEQLGLMSA